MKHHSRDREKKLADDARLMRASKAWHQEQLHDALAGAHGATIAKLMMVLDGLELASAGMLLDCVRRTDWNSVSYDVRLTVLHQINESITRLRERKGLSPIDDPIPPKQNAFLWIKQLLFPASPVKTGTRASEVATAERSGRDVTATVQTERE